MRSWNRNASQSSHSFAFSKRATRRFAVFARDLATTLSEVHDVLADLTTDRIRIDMLNNARESHRHKGQNQARGTIRSVRARPRTGHFIPVTRRQNPQILCSSGSIHVEYPQVSYHLRRLRLLILLGHQVLGTECTSAHPWPRSNERV